MIELTALSMFAMAITAVLLAVACFGFAYAARTVTTRETRLDRAAAAVARLKTTVAQVEYYAARVGVVLGAVAVLASSALIGAGCAGQADCTRALDNQARHIAARARYVSEDLDGAFAVPTDDCAVMVFTDDHVGYRVPLSDSACELLTPSERWSVTPVEPVHPQQGHWPGCGSHPTTWTDAQAEVCSAPDAASYTARLLRGRLSTFDD